MWNLLLGAVCGAVLAGTAVLAAVRSPAVQERLGIVRVDAPLAPRGTDPSACPPAAVPAPAPGAATPDMLFTRQRLWSVPP